MKTLVNYICESWLEIFDKTAAKRVADFYVSHKLISKTDAKKLQNELEGESIGDTFEEFSEDVLPSMFDYLYLEVDIDDASEDFFDKLEELYYSITKRPR